MKPPRASRVVQALLWGGALLGFVGCGDALVEGSYAGEPLVLIEGDISIHEPDLGYWVDTSHIHISLFWMDDLGQNQNGFEVREPRRNDQIVTLRNNALASYRLSLYQPPSEDTLFLLDGQRVGVALLSLYVDRDNDGRWTDPGLSTLSEEETDFFLGGTSEFVLLYAPGAVESPWLGGSVPAGFHLMRVAENGACAPGGLASLQRAALGTQVELHVGSSLEISLPDIDCDGTRADWCENIFDFAKGVELSEDDREFLRLEYERCVIFEEQGDCAGIAFDLEQFGELIREESPEYYEYLQEEVEFCKEDEEAP